jgi:hypothetical protein
MIIYHLPCKDHVKHYLEFCFGVKGKPVSIRNDSYIGKHFFLLVNDASDKRDSEFEIDVYRNTVPVKITQDMVLRKGCVLTKTNIRAFNTFVSDHFKSLIHAQLDTLCEIKGMQIKYAIDLVYEKYDMDESILTHEAIRKDYQREKKRLKALQTEE